MDKPEEIPDNVDKPKVETKTEPLAVKEAEQENLSNEEKSSNDEVILLEIHYFDRTSGHKKCKLPFKVEPLPLADVEGLNKNFCKKNPETGVQKQFKCLPCVCRIEAAVALKQHLKGLVCLQL